MKTFEATIQVPNSSPTKVRVQAKTSTEARNLVEMQYGAGCIMAGPMEVR